MNRTSHVADCLVDQLTHVVALTRSRGRIARSLEVVELLVSSLGCFGARERYKTAALSLPIDAIRKPVLLAFGGLFFGVVRREDPPDPISETHVPASYAPTEIPAAP
jgi:hypothetical protein